MDGRIARIEDSVQRIAAVAADIKEDHRQIKEDYREIRQSVSNLKIVTISSAVGAALAIIFGVASFNAALTSNMLSAFQAGHQASTASK